MATPARIGIVDMGSNAVRMLIAEITPAGIAVLENHRLPLRLGHEVFHSGQVSAPAIDSVVDAFRRFKANCERQGVQQVRAIATAALREARNRDLLVDRIRSAAGIEVEVISGTQESYLLTQAVQTKVDLRRGRSVLVDVGGGSVEVVVVDDGQVVAADSYRLGALRMLAMLPDPAATGDTFVDLLQRHLHGLERRIGDHFAQGRIDRYVAVGGNIESIAELLGHDSRLVAIPALPIADVRREVEALAALTVEQRMAQRGLRPDRADTIVPAGIVYVRIGELAGCARILVPRVGIKEGLLAEIAAGHVDAFAPEEHVDTVLSSCRALGRRFDYEAEHAETVLTLARQLFDHTRPLHGLDARARVLLDAAALLHDIGVAINNDGHHKHSQYIVQSSDLVGLADDERNLVALLTRYHRRAAPSREHEEFARLRRRERSLVERLAALLRLADALDRQHAGLVRGIRVDVGAEHIEITPLVVAGQHSALTLERQAIAEKGELFTQLFGRNVKLGTPRPQ